MKGSTSLSSLGKSAELNTREGPLLSLVGSDISWYMLCAPLLSWIAAFGASLGLAVNLALAGPLESDPRDPCILGISRMPVWPMC